MEPMNRRTVLHATAIASLAGLAGCSGSIASNEFELEGDSARGNSTDHETTETDGDSLEDWLATANDPHPPRIRDLRFDDPPTVYLGVSNPKAFAPPAIMVAPDTTVTWEWIGEGGEHNVVATDGTFDSGEPVAEGGTTFRYTFDMEGAYRYVCEPHADEGMRGVVVVESAPTSEYPKVDEWLAGIEAYDGTITDRADAGSVEVAVGAEGNGGDFAFDPMAVKISTGTTVRWAWSGGAHNVTFEDAEFGRDKIVSESGVHFEHTFTESGVFRYYCAPHRAIGERGAIVVE